MSHPRNNVVRVEIVQEQDGEVLSRSVVVEYHNLVNAFANRLNLLLFDGVRKGVKRVAMRLGRAKAFNLDQLDEWIQFDELDD